MKDTLSFIVSSIVTKPENVNIQEESSDEVINFIITVDSEDMGKIIGKNGKIIKAVRNVMKIPAMKENKRINITLSQDSA